MAISCQGLASRPSKISGLCASRNLDMAASRRLVRTLSNNPDKYAPESGITSLPASSIPLILQVK